MLRYLFYSLIPSLTFIKKEDERDFPAGKGDNFSISVLREEPDVA